MTSNTKDQTRIRSAPSVLIIEGEAADQASQKSGVLLKEFLEKHNFLVRRLSGIGEVSKYDLTAFSLIISDLPLSEISSADIIGMAPNVPVIVMTSTPSLRSAVNIMKLGAADYIKKPVDFDELLETINDLIPTFEEDIPLIELQGSCSKIRTLRAQIEKVALTDVNVLIEGESGTGKGLIAKLIHHGSNRSDKQMISLHCATMSGDLIDAALFGQGGDLTGTGLLAAARGSTLFLDEIGDLSAASQARLLRVLQAKEALGSSAQETQMRLITTTDRDLQNLVAECEYRKDLFYRLNVVQLSVPPLRERGADALILAHEFLAQNNRARPIDKLVFSKETLDAIQSYFWPGNVRELENAVQRAVILCKGNVIQPALLAIDTCPRMAIIPVPGDDSHNGSLKGYLQWFVLANQNTMTEIELARKLGISRKSLWQNRKKMKIPRKTSRHG